MADENAKYDKIDSSAIYKSASFLYVILVVINTKLTIHTQSSLDV